MSKLIALSAALLLSTGTAFAQTAAPQRLAPVEPPPAVVTAQVDLGAEYPQIPGLKGFVLTQMLFTVPPGTGRAMHSHVGMPEIVRIISGTLTEAHNGGPPTQYGPGSTLRNAEGTQHMWANLGTEPAVFVTTVMHGPRAPAK